MGVLIDTLTNKEHYILDLLNITDTNLIACKLVNYLRYSFRFMSAYLVIAFTIQRLNAINNPLKTRTKTKRTAWNSACVISLVSFVFNSFTPFVFHLELNINHKNHCDVKAELKLEYFLFNSVYMLLIVIVPSLTIFVCNCLIIKKNNENNSINKSLTIHSRKANENECRRKKRFFP